MNLNIIEESFLYDYYLLDIATGEFGDKKLLLNFLGELYDINQKRLVTLAKLLDDQEVLEIKTLADYYRYRRIQQYVNNFVENKAENDIDNVIGIKGGVLIRLNNLEYRPASTRKLVSDEVTKLAQKSTVEGYVILGISQALGILFEKNLEDGLASLDKASKWGNLLAILASIKLSLNKEDHEKHFSRLITKVDKTNFKELINCYQNRYGFNKVNGSLELELFLSLLNSGRLEEANVDTSMARLIYCQTIGIADKQRLLFSNNRALVTEVCDLPINIKYKPLNYNLEALENNLIFAKEKEKISQLLRQTSSRNKSIYRPMSFVSNSVYVRTKVLALIKDLFEDANISDIDVKSLERNDVQNNPMNFVFSNIRERKNNVLVLNFAGDIDSDIMDDMKEFLDINRRKNFPISLGNLKFDLSSVLIVVVADKTNSSLLANLTNPVNITLSNDNKEAILNDLIKDKVEEYRFNNMEIEAELVNELLKLQIDSVNQFFERICQDVDCPDGLVKVSLADYEKYRKGRSSNQYGFRGGK